MSNTLFPTLAQPIVPVAPDVPYSGMLVWLAFAPRIDGATVDATLSLRAQPYRLLGDVVDMAPEGLIQTINVASVADAMANDAQLANTIAQLVSTILAYLE